MNFSEREKCNKAFTTLLSIYKDLQQVVIEDRKLFKERFQLQQDQWITDVRDLETEVSMLKSKVIEAEIDRNLAYRKMDLMLSMKQKDSCLLKLKLEYAESDVGDFREYIDYITYKLSALIEKSGGECSNRNTRKGGTESNYMETAIEDERCIQGLESELEKLKRDYETFFSRKDSEVSGFLIDRNFAWSQFEKMVRDYISSQQSHRVQLEQANEKIEKLLTGMGQLESSNSEKDEIISKLKAELTQFEADTDESKKEISRLSKEVAMLRNSKAASLTPMLNSCTTRSQTRGMETQKVAMDRSKNSHFRSPASLTPMLKDCRTRSQTRGMETQKVSMDRSKNSRFRSPASLTPMSKACRTRSQTRGMETQKVSMDRSKNSRVRSPILNKGSPGCQASDINMNKKPEATEPRTRKRKPNEKISISDTPKLFTSTFKVPKLKDASPGIA